MDKKPTWQINEARFHRRLAHIKGKLFCGNDDCWLWSSTCFKRRYANGRVKKIPYLQILDAGTRATKQVYARRFAWEMTYGPIPEDHSIQNICGEETCVKPGPKHNILIKHGLWLHPEGQTAKIVVVQEPRKKRDGVPSEEEFMNDGE